MNKILVIDDNPNDRLVIRKILSSQGNTFEIHEANNGELGIELALEIDPDLIICDVLMPKTDGYRVLQRLRVDKSTEVIPFIFLTAKNDLTDLRKGMNLGADDYLIKPFEARDLLLQAVNTRLKRFSGVKHHYEEQIKPNLEELNQQLNYDSVTQLPNRFLFQEKFSNLIKKWYKSSQQIIPIISLKLDNWKNVVHKHGDKIGDLLIQEIADRLLTFVGKDNVIAHINENEFVIILTPITDQTIISTIVESISSETSAPVKIKGTKIKIFPQLKIGISLSYLQSFPVDIIKIDQCLVRNINNNEKNLARIHSIVELTHKLNLQVIAEGVETQAELDTLISLGCDMVQGYFYSEPLPFTDFLRLLRSFN